MRRTSFLHDPIAWIRQRYGMHILLGTAGISFTVLLFNLVLLTNSLSFVPKDIASQTKWLFIATPMPIGIVPMTGDTLSGYYVFLVIAILLSALFLAQKDLLKGMDLIKKHTHKLVEPSMWEGNYLFLFPRLLSIMFFIPVISYLVVEAFGQGYSVPSFGTLSLSENFYGFANASVWEEIIIRVLFLGIPLAVYSKILYGWKPRILTGFEKMDKTALGLLVISSMLFALAHAYGGWDLYKVPPTFFTGMALGYAFIKRGLPGAIVLHFALDFFTMPSRMWPSLEPLLGILFIPMLLAGGYYTILYITDACKAIRNMGN